MQRAYFYSKLINFETRECHSSAEIYRRNNKFTPQLQLEDYRGVLVGSLHKSSYDIDVSI